MVGQSHTPRFLGDLKYQKVPFRRFHVFLKISKIQPKINWNFSVEEEESLLLDVLDAQSNMGCLEPKDDKYINININFGLFIDISWL